MLITTKTVISFHIPEECQAAERFKANNYGWVEMATSQCVGFIKQETYEVEIKPNSDPIASLLLKEDSECRKN